MADHLSKGKTERVARMRATSASVTPFTSALLVQLRAPGKSRSRFRVAWALRSFRHGSRPSFSPFFFLFRRCHAFGAVLSMASLRVKVMERTA